MAKNIHKPSHHNIPSHLPSLPWIQLPMLSRTARTRTTTRRPPRAQVVLVFALSPHPLARIVKLPGRVSARGAAPPPPDARDAPGPATTTHHGPLETARSTTGATATTATTTTNNAGDAGTGTGAETGMPVAPPRRTAPAVVTIVPLSVPRARARVEAVRHTSAVAREGSRARPRM